MEGNDEPKLVLVRAVLAGDEEKVMAILETATVEMLNAQVKVEYMYRTILTYTKLKYIHNLSS